MANEQRARQRSCPPECPHPIAETVEEIGFVRKPMTDWLSPVELARAGVKAAVAGTFGSYADKRELQAALTQLDDADQSFQCENGALWFDYVADLGDGFDPTYAIARLLAGDLTLAFDNAVHETRRGAFLILGGDQVYPTAARDDYQNRFLGPFRAALPYLGGTKQPAVFALPGNHDWYDGLTSFLRIFCQQRLNGGGRWIGAWRTRQRRSYFAIRLPQDWWIWAVDSQLESDLDHPQLIYFEKVIAKIPEEERAKQKIILVAAEPSWVNCPHANAPKSCRRQIEAFNTLAHFEKTYIRSKNLQLRLVLSGDLHHYVRYASDESGVVRITSGGGGAYLLGTELMPEKLHLREGTRETVPAEEPHRVYEKVAAFPNGADSRRLAGGLAALPFRNWKFGMVLGVIYLLLGWLYLAGPLAFPFALALAAVFVLGTYAYTKSKSKGFSKWAKVGGVLHGVVHIALCWLLLRASSIHTLPQLADHTLRLFAGGWLGGGWLYAVYTWIMLRTFGVHHEEVFSSMAIQDYKSFLRFRLGDDGTLTVHAIGLRKVPHDWKFTPPGPDDHGAPWFDSRQFRADADHTPQLIERFELHS